MNKMTHYSKYKWQFKSLPYTPVISPKHFMITTDKETKEQIFIFYNVADAEADRLHVKRIPCSGGLLFRNRRLGVGLYLS
jgi:hypothetical protein